MNSKFLSLIVALLLVSSSCTEKTGKADYQIIPLPQNVEYGAENTGTFLLSNSTKIAYPEGDSAQLRNAKFLAEYVKDMTGRNIEIITDNGETNNVIILKADIDPALTGSASAEGYLLTVDAEKVVINGVSEAGTFYGIQTLRKSLPVNKGNVELPSVTIKDFPRFAYRGAHLDVCRHFFPLDSVKRFIDMIALHNINNLHWHISEDQGWRIEIKKYPLLTEIGSKREGTCIGKDFNSCDSIPYGGYFTQEEAKEIVKYAAERHINVIPEIDLPGHMQGALAAYPHLGCTGGPYKVWTRWGISEDVLCAGNDSVLIFLGDVLDEITEIFPSEYIHIGGDECPKVRWKECPKCQAKIKQLGLKGDKEHSAEQYLQSYIMKWAEKHLADKGRKIIGWDEILEGEIGPNATVHSWRGASAGANAAKMGHDAIMSPSEYLYFDFYQTEDKDSEYIQIGGYTPVSKVYGFEPVAEGLTPEQAKHIIGVQPNMWTEYIHHFWQIEYQELPRLAAASEVQWTMPEKKDYSNFVKRLSRYFDIYNLYNYHYAKHVFEVASTVKPDKQNKCVTVQFATIDDAPIYYTLDGSEPTAKSQIYTQPLQITESCTYKAKAIRKSGETKTVSGDVVFSKNSYKPTTLLTEPNPRYVNGGAWVLCDALLGSESFGSDYWLGYLANELVATIDFEEPTETSMVTVSTLVLPGDWIFNARSVKVEVSTDGNSYKEVAIAEYPALAADSPTGKIALDIEYSPITAQYMKLTVTPERSIPDWHAGKGGWGFLFVDEISVN